MADFTLKRTGPWVKASLLLGAGGVRRVNRAIDKAVQQEAQLARKEIIKGIRSQAPGGKRFKPLRPSTIAARQRAGFRGRKALIRTGTLIRNITVKKAGSRGAFVGVLRSARSANGGPLVDIASVHEFGSRDGRIPARPFLAPVFDKLNKPADEVQQRILRRVGTILNGDFGRV